MGVEYSGYSSSNLKDGLAIVFGKGMAEVESYEMETDEAGALYAQHKFYSFEATVKHPISYDMITVVGLTFGNNRGSIMMRQSRDGSTSFSTDDPNEYLVLDPVGSDTKVVDGKLVVKFRFSPSFNYPTNLFEDLTFGVYGLGVIPAITVFQDMYWVETNLDLTGTLEAHTDDGYVSNGGWVSGGEEFFFRGVTATYPQTKKSPMPGAYTIEAEDRETGLIWTQNDVEGEINLSVMVDKNKVTKSYRVRIGKIPSNSDISELPNYVIKVDPFKPNPPGNFEIHADSYEDPTVNFDDDNEVYVTWDPAEDLESGVKGYYLSSLGPESDPSEAQVYEYVEHPMTSIKLFLVGDGAKKLFIWSVDQAGNPSSPVFAVTKVDKTPVTYSEFSPGDQVWVNTRTPICSVLISDGEGSGVSARDVEYSVATSSRYEFGPWLKVSGIRDSQELRLSVRATFINGKNNYIRFRAKDGAGNGWTMSPEYNVWVDEQPPYFTNFRPYEGDYQNGNVVVVSVDITDSSSIRDGSGVLPSTIQYRYSTAGVGLFGDWLDAPVISYEGDVARISMEQSFVEGDSNYIQFRCYDDVGNYATSREYNVKVNSAPMVDASVSPPVNGLVYTTDEKIYFDASGTEDPDGDDLQYEWYSDIDGFLSGESSNFRSLSAGLHEVTLLVNDPAHSVVRTFELLVKQPSQIDPTSIDSDGDGLYDAWEVAYGLDPERPDAFYDSDFDTFSNMQEFQNMTAPDDPNSHPPYALSVEGEDDDEESDLSDQYLILLLLLIGLSLIVLVVLSILFLSKRSSFVEDVEEEKELEREEIDYRKALEARKKK